MGIASPHLGPDDSEAYRFTSYDVTHVGQNTSVSRINEKLASVPAWDATAICKRHALLLELAEVIWKTKPIEI